MKYHEYCWYHPSHIRAVLAGWFRSRVLSQLPGNALRGRRLHLHPLLARLVWWGQIWRHHWRTNWGSHWRPHEADPWTHPLNPLPAPWAASLGRYDQWMEGNASKAMVASSGKVVADASVDTASGTMGSALGAGRMAEAALAVEEVDPTRLWLATLPELGLVAASEAWAAMAAASVGASALLAGSVAKGRRPDCSRRSTTEVDGLAPWAHHRWLRPAQSPATRPLLHDVPPVDVSCWRDRDAATASPRRRLRLAATSHSGPATTHVTSVWSPCSPPPNP